MMKHSSARLLLVTVFVGGAFAAVPSLAAAKAGWITTKVAEGGTAGAYCAVSRQFDETTITVGRTVNGQSSLALEMKKTQLDPKKTYRLSLKPGNADRVEIETKPLNAHTFVLNLDQVVDLPASFSATPTLQLRYDENSLALSLANWSSAHNDLQACLASLSGVSATNKNVAMNDGPGVAVEPKAPIKMGDKVSVKEERLEPRPPEEMARGSEPPLKNDRDQLNAELVKTREELATLKSSRAADRDAGAKDLKAQQDQAMRLATLENENEKLRVEVAQAKTDYNGAVAEKAALTAKADANAKMADTSKEQAAKAGETQMKLAQAQAEVELLRHRLDEANAKPKGPSVEDLQQRMENLSSENVKLRADLAAATMPENEMKVTVAAEAPLRQQLRDLRSENDALRARSTELTKLLDHTRNDGDVAMIKASGGSWDLEQSTRRLQEAEREVQRLSLSLRDTKTQCDAEKKEIEYMLFDTKLAKDGQIALLNSLEDQIAILKAGQGVGTTKPVATAAVNMGAPISPALLAPPVPEKPVMVAAPTIKAETLAAPAAVAAVANTSGPIGITALLKQAGVAMTTALQPVAKNPFGDGKAWVWESDVLAGMAVQQSGVKTASFDGQVSQKIKKLKTMCKGDFAAQPAAEQNNPNLHYAAYDAACIAGANSTSAALLFYQQNGEFNVISHEAAPDDMAQAMEARDRIITTLAGK